MNKYGILVQKMLIIQVFINIAEYRRQFWISQLIKGTLTPYTSNVANTHNFALAGELNRT